VDNDDSTLQSWKRTSVASNYKQIAESEVLAAEVMKSFIFCERTARRYIPKRKITHDHIRSQSPRTTHRPVGTL
jgi:hypothetical protein